MSAALRTWWEARAGRERGLAIGALLVALAAAQYGLAVDPSVFFTSWAKPLPVLSSELEEVVLAPAVALESDGA